MAFFSWAILFASAFSSAPIISSKRSISISHSRPRTASSSSRRRYLPLPSKLHGRGSSTSLFARKRPDTKLPTPDFFKGAPSTPGYVPSYIYYFQLSFMQQQQQPPDISYIMPFRRLSLYMCQLQAGPIRQAIVLGADDGGESTYRGRVRSRWPLAVDAMGYVKSFYLFILIFTLIYALFY